MPAAAKLTAAALGAAIATLIAAGARAGEGAPGEVLRERKLFVKGGKGDLARLTQLEAAPAVTRRKRR